MIVAVQRICTLAINVNICHVREREHPTTYAGLFKASLLNHDFHVYYSDNGVCLTMRELAGMTYDAQKKLSGVTYNEPWDAE